MHWQCPQTTLTRDDTAQRCGGLSVRQAGLLAALPCWAMLLVAAMLTPRSIGFGTHEDLHLPACSMLARTGWPCPTCGMTTSVAAAVHGQWCSSLADQPFGLVLAAAAVVLGLAGSYQAMTGADMLHRLRFGIAWFIVGSVGLLAGWVYILLAGKASGLFPLH